METLTFSREWKHGTVLWTFLGELYLVGAFLLFLEGVFGAKTFLGGFPRLETLPGGSRMVASTVVGLSILLGVVIPLAFFHFRARRFGSAHLSSDSIHFFRPVGPWSSQRLVSLRDIDQVWTTGHGVRVTVRGDRWLARRSPLLIPTESEEVSDRVVGELGERSPHAPNSVLDLEWESFHLSRSIGARLRLVLVLAFAFALALAPLAFFVLGGPKLTTGTGQVKLVVAIFALSPGLWAVVRLWLTYASPRWDDLLIEERSLLSGVQRFTYGEERGLACADGYLASADGKLLLVRVGDREAEVRAALEKALARLELPPPSRALPLAATPARQQRQWLIAWAVLLGSLVLTSGALRALAAT